MAGILSATTYSSVAKAQQTVVLQNPLWSAEVLGNGSLLLTFSIELRNPTEYRIQVTSLSWYAKVFNTTGQDFEGAPWIQVARDLSPSGATYLVEAGSVRTYSYAATVADAETLSRLEGFFAWCAAHGGPGYTLATAPYHFEFNLSGWLGDFEHDYLREIYLNNLVKIDRSYYSWWEE